MPGYFPKGAETLFIGTNPGQLNKRKSGWDDNSYSEADDWSVFQKGYAKGLFEAPMGRFLQEGMGDRQWAFTNIIKCRTPDNNPPLREEIEECRPWLENQIKMLQPRAIVTLGAVSFNWFDPKYSLDRVLGKLMAIERPFYKGLFMAMYHPAYLRYKHDKFTKMYFEKLIGTLSSREAYRTVVKSGYLL